MQNSHLLQLLIDLFQCLEILARVEHSLRVGTHRKGDLVDVQDLPLIELRRMRGDELINFRLAYRRRFRRDGALHLRAGQNLLARPHDIQVDSGFSVQLCRQCLLDQVFPDDDLGKRPLLDRIGAFVERYICQTEFIFQFLSRNRFVSDVRDNLPRGSVRLVRCPVPSTTCQKEQRPASCLNSDNPNFGSVASLIWHQQSPYAAVASKAFASG